MCKSISLWVINLELDRFLLVSVILLCVSFTGFSQQELKEVSGKYQTNVWIYTPPGYSETRPTGYPVLLSLHGGSAIVENNDPQVLVLNVGNDGGHLVPARLIARGAWRPDLEFIVVSPHLKRDLSVPLVNEQTWPTDLLNEVVEYVKEEYNVDATRLYVTGISVGATGTWDYALNYPEKVAAILPLGGKGARTYACNLKDVPIWAFHGQDDNLVPNRFSTDMVNAILDCPDKKYVPHVTLNNSMAHEIWNPLYTGTGGYDIYAWMLSFIKGDDTNKAPFVFAGNNRKVKLSAGPMFLFADFFDSDGSIASVSWSKLSGPGIAMEDTNSEFLKLPTPVAGTFVFRCTVTDDDGVSSSDDVQLTIQNTADAREITNMTLYQQDPSTTDPVWDGRTLIGPVTSDMVVDISTITSGRINIEAAINSGTRVKWSINGDQHTRDNTLPYYLKLVTSRLNTTGWGVFKGTYLVCATPFPNQLMLPADEGTSLCYRITLTDDLGIQKFFPITGSALPLHNIARWNSNSDGSGAAPTSFTSDNQWFILPSGNSTISSNLTISGLKSRLVVPTSGTLNVSAALSAPLHIEGKGTLNVTGAGSVTGYSSVSRSSQINYTGTTAIPGSNLVVGNLFIGGSGVRAHMGGQTNVRGNLVIAPGVDLQASANSSTSFAVSGNIDIGTASTRPYNLRFLEGYGDQNLRLPGSHTFRTFVIETGSTVNVIAPPGSTLTIGSPVTFGGQLDVHSYALLKLNGTNVSLTQNAGLNVTAGATQRLGKIELSGSNVTVMPTTPLLEFNLYPAKTSNQINLLDVKLPNSHVGFDIGDSLFVRTGVRIADGRINSNGKLTLLSTPTATAYIDEVVGTGTIVGNVNVQRYIAPGRQYRYLSFPVKNFTVAKLQQYIPVTGGFQNASTGPGLSSSPSLFTWNEPTYSWNAYPSASQDNQMPLTDGNGYAVFVRSDDRPTTMVMSGDLHIGNKTFTLNDNPQPNDTLGWTLVGNPYAAPIVWKGNEAPLTGWAATDVDPSVHVRDNELNNFRVWDGEAGDLSGGIIPIGQSFWVRSITSAATLTIQESAKEPTSTPELYRAKRSDVPALGITVKRDKMQSQAFIKFKPWGDHIFIRGRDTMKKRGDVLNVSLLSSDDRSVAIKSLCDTLCRQEIGVLVEAKKPGHYTLSTAGLAFDKMIDKLTLKDAFTGSAVELKEDDDYVFEITPDLKSRARNRFTLIMAKAGSEQPIISLQDGYLVSSIDADVQWALNGVDIDGANQGVLLPSGEGDYTVRTIGKKCTQSSSAFSYRVTSLPEHLHPVQVFPVPANDEIQLSGLASRGPIKYEIRSVNGAQIKTGEAGTSEGGTATLDVRALPSGLYLLVLRDSAVRIVKFAITR